MSFPTVRFHPSHLVCHETRPPVLPTTSSSTRKTKPPIYRPFTTSSTASDLKKLRQERKEAHLLTYIKSHRPSSLRSKIETEQQRDPKTVPLDDSYCEDWSNYSFALGPNIPSTHHPPMHRLMPVKEPMSPLISGHWTSQLHSLSNTFSKKSCRSKGGPVYSS